MEIRVGDCFKGRITRIVPWGAFVVLDDSNVSGMIHISELSCAYVRDVSVCVAVGDEVLVKVLSVDDRGRIALSRRQAMTEDEQTSERNRLCGGRHKNGAGYDARRASAKDTPYSKKADSRTAASADPDLEEMLRRFRISSEETRTSLRRSAGAPRTRRKR